MTAPARKRGAGRLRHVLKLNTVTKTRDGYGSTTDALTDFSDPIRGEVKTISSGQGGDDAVPGENLYRIDLRYRAGITKQHSVTWTNNGGMVLDIVGINEDEKFSGWMHLICKGRDLG